MTPKELAEALQKFLYKNNLSIIEVYALPANEFAVSLSGDWKHDHIRCDYQVKQFFDEHGYIIKDMSKDVTFDDGSSCYTADHFYKVEKQN